MTCAPTLELVNSLPLPLTGGLGGEQPAAREKNNSLQIYRVYIIYTFINIFGDITATSSTIRSFNRDVYEVIIPSLKTYGRHNCGCTSIHGHIDSDGVDIVVSSLIFLP